MAQPTNEDTLAAFGRLQSVEHALTATNGNVTQMGTAINQLTSEIARLIALQSVPVLAPVQPPPPPPPISSTRVNLHLPLPTPYTGIPGEFPIFKIKICQAIRGNLIQEPDQQIDYASGALQGAAAVWYQGLLEANGLLSPSYTLDSFLAALEGYFGGSITLQTREKALFDLRQSSSVTELAIAFQNITNTFDPRWPDHPLIYTFSQKLKSEIRYELFSRGGIPTDFQGYITAAVSIENNLAAANRSRHGQPPPSPRPTPRPGLLPSPGPQPQGSDPMQVDGTRGNRGIPTPEERARRQSANLCHTCGQPGHHARECGKGARGGQSAYQLRGVPALPPGAPSGYPDVPPGYQLGYIPLGAPPVYPTPWAQLPPPPSPHTSFVPPPGPKNSNPSQ